MLCKPYGPIFRFILKLKKRNVRLSFYLYAAKTATSLTNVSVSAHATGIHWWQHSWRRWKLLIKSTEDSVNDKKKLICKDVRRYLHLCNSNLKQYKGDATPEENVIAHSSGDLGYFSFKYRLYFWFLLKVPWRNKVHTPETVLFTYSKSIKP